MATRRADGLVPLHFRYRDAHGISRRKTVYGKTQKEAQKKKADFLADVKAALRIDQAGRTVASWADEWLEVYKKNAVSHQTYACYKNDLRHLKKAIGGLTMRSVTQTDIMNAYASRKGASGSALRQYKVTTRALFKAAVANRMIPYNPAEGAVPPTGEDGTHRALTDAEIGIILAVARDKHPFTLPILLMLFAGLRRGEMAGIKPDRDIVDGFIYVREATTWPSNQPVTGKPKTPAAIRAIPIMPPLRPFLDLPMKPLSESAFRSGMRSFLTACSVKLNGCTKRWQPEDHVWKVFSFRCHDLRHTFATMLYDAGVDVKTAQRWLGHTDPAITMRIYTHLSKEREQAATALAVEHIGGKYGGKEKQDTPNNIEKTG
ncbi:MAG: tyrosine-type recombinase/integrase [Christensenellales bacterium]